MVVYQMLQQQRQREIQHLSPMVAQSPGLLPSATASPRQGGQGGQGNPLFGLQESALHKPGVSVAMLLLLTTTVLLMNVPVLTVSRSG